MYKESNLLFFKSFVIIYVDKWKKLSKNILCILIGDYLFFLVWGMGWIDTC